MIVANLGYIFEPKGIHFFRFLVCQQQATNSIGPTEQLLLLAHYAMPPGYLSWAPNWRALLVCWCVSCVLANISSREHLFLLEPLLARYVIVVVFVFPF